MDMDSSIDPYDTPALSPPPGVISNYDDPPTTAGPLVAGLAIMITVATLAFGARMFTKLYIMKRIQLDDYALILGWAFYIVYQSTIIAQTPYSTGRHEWDVSLAQLADFKQFLNYSEILYCCCMLFTKLAILLQLQKIFRGTSRDSVYWLSICLMVISTLYYLTGILIEILQCTPREKIWNPSVPGSCVNNDVNILVSGGFNLALDFTIFMLPIYAILQLKIAVKRKLGICAIFATGLLACISSLLRLYYSIELIQAIDVTYEDAYLSWSASLEGASAILVASFPVMPRLYQFIRGEKPKGSSPRPSYHDTFGSSSNSRGLWSSVKKLGTVTSKSTQTSDSVTQLRDEWVPIKDAQGYGLSNAQVTVAEKALPGVPKHAIRETIRIETRYEMPELRSTFED